MTRKEVLEDITIQELYNWAKKNNLYLIIK